MFSNNQDLNVEISRRIKRCEINKNLHNDAKLILNQSDNYILCILVQRHVKENNPDSK